MKRVDIKTPGKFLAYRGIQVRTPTYLNIKDEDLNGLKMYLKLYGIDDYKVTTVSDDIKETKPSKRNKRGLKTIRNGKSGSSLNLKIGG